MTHASLCTGLGAGEIAATWLDWENIFMAEIDSFCRKILKYYFPNAKLYGDITKQSFRKHRGQIDVLSAGFPCQPFSVSGKRRGADDHRYLWASVHRIVDEVRPSWFIGENVAGITSMVQQVSETKMESQSDLFETAYRDALLESDFILRRIIRDLEEIGYSVQPVIVPACALGAPHRRDRIFILASDSTDTRLEGLQQERENGVSFAGIITDTHSHDAERCRYGETGCEAREGEKPKTKRERIRANAERIGKEGFLAYAKRQQLQDWSQECNAPDKSESRAGMDGRVKRSGDTCMETATSDTISLGSNLGHEHHNGTENNKGIGEDILRKRVRPRCERTSPNTDHFNGDSAGLHPSEISQHQATGILEMPNWDRFPTQSPILGRNDGFSELLHGISLSKWRQESIKGYGNAIVPQELHEIYKIIEMIEKGEIKW